MTRQREQARKNGLCFTCCKGIPQPGRVICIACNAAALVRKRRKRERNREVAKFQYVVVAHERAGDIARDHNFHEAAAQHYQDALNITIPPEDHNRISEKLVQVLFLSGEPDAVNPWYDRLLASYLEAPHNGIKAIDILLKIARQLWIDAKTKEAPPVITRAIQLAERIGDQHRQKLANLTMCNYMRILGNQNEAKRILDTVHIDNKDAASLRAIYYRQKAEIAGASGNAAIAFNYFERALLAAKDDVTSAVVLLWQTYAHWGVVLGRIDLAQSCIERALLISRQNQFIWRIPYICLSYADILARLGQYNPAYNYLIEALSYDAHAAVLDKILAEFGIPLALYMKDQATLVKCARPSTLMLAFQSEEPSTIGPVAAAFAKFYDMQGKRREARALLHRAIEKVSPIEYSWELPLEVARRGALTDIPRARDLLETRIALPCSDVDKACLSLFDAYIARRKNDLLSMRTYARDAVEKFEALRWYAYADKARSMISQVSDMPRSNRIHSASLSDIASMLTEREKQVADFVLRGFTNRIIAEKLLIKENTVEKHMTSIMGRLGIRSRHQLADIAEDGRTLPEGSH